MSYGFGARILARSSAARVSHLSQVSIAEKTGGRQSLEYALLLASMAVLPTQLGNRESVIVQLREAIAANRRTGSVRELTIVRACLALIFSAQKRSFIRLDVRGAWREHPNWDLHSLACWIHY